VKVTPAGRKVFLVQYRLRGQRITRRVTIGRHGSPWTVDRARREALQILAAVADGKDPQAERESRKGNVNTRDVSARWMEEHVGTKRRPRTVKDYRRLLDLHALPALGAKPFVDVTRAEIVRIHHGMRATPSEANHVLRVVSAMFGWAERQGLRPAGSNPCKHVEKFPEHGRERFLSPRELARLGRALRVAERRQALTPWMAGAIRLLVFTGARLNEILTARWDYVDLAAGTMRLPISKTGAKTIHLNPPAVEVLSALTRLQGNPYLIAGGKPGSHLVNLQKPWRRVRKAALLTDVRLHDIRHSFASVGAAGGHSLPLIGGLLGHSQPATTARYAHLAADPLKAASAAIASQIEAAMQGKDARVLPMRRHIGST